MGETISNAKAGNLFWLGRYTERVHVILHFLRKYRDRMIDEDADAYHLFCEKLGIENCYTSCDDFLNRFLFDKTNKHSLISILTCASDNAIVLRQEIKSETLAYIQLAICHIEQCACINSDVDVLQPVTDSLMAFWGSIDERIHKRDARNMIKAGKYLEKFDLHIRFDYPRERINYLFDRLEKHIQKEKSIFDQNSLFELKLATEQPFYNKQEILGRVDRLFTV
ncbi:MAG: alpha-E domain-containing protein [Dysgonamonadaceae bacterium]|jgi:uncharacterized alpha-E superfamily protein|nr:alpha-E domain-containing protein [Dysgonamonadaceae bacterium]